MHEAAAATSGSDTSDSGDLLCGACGYNLRGSPTNRCPECGQQFDPNHLVANLVPWEQRKWIGRGRAFFRTAWMGTVRVGKLAQKMNWPVNLSSARWFRCWVCIVTAAAVTAGLVWWRSESGFHPPSRYQQLYLETQTALWVFLFNPYSFGVVAGAIIIWLIACINVVSSFFYTKNLTPERQKRVVALSAYTSATFAWLPITIPICAWTIALNRTINPLGAFGNAILILCWLAYVVQSISWLKARRRGSLSRNEARGRLIIALVTAAIMGFGYWLVWWGFKSQPYITVRLTLSDSVLIFGVIGLSLAVFWFNTVRLYRRTMGATLSRTIRTGALMFLTWLALGVMILGTTQAVSVMVQVLLAAR